MIIENIIGFIKKHFQKKDILIMLGILALFFSTRLINILKFPIFNDEGIYIQWAKTAWHDANWRFISLTDGKQPLQTWGTIPFLKLFPDNALLAGRLFAVTTGLASLIGVFSLFFYLFNKKTAYIGSILYIFTPYFLFYDRLALSDSGVNAGFIWILFFAILLAKKNRLDAALIFGVVGGIALLTKSSAQVFLLLGGLGPIFFLVPHSLGEGGFSALNKKNVLKILNFYFLFIITVTIAFVIYNIQRLSPFFHFVSEKNKVFLLSFSEFIKTPFLVFFHNIQTLPIYVFWEMGFVLGFIGLIGLIKLIIKEGRLGIYIFVWLFALYIGVSFFTRILFPRYLIFFATLLLITSSFYISIIKNKALKFSLLLLLTVSFLFFDYPILFNISSILFPPVDRGQYLEGWTAGWGIKEIMDYARIKSQEKPVIILAEGNFGMTGDVLNVFLKRNDRIFIKGYWPLGYEQIIENRKELDKNYVYVVISHQNSLPDLPLPLIKAYTKPGGQSTIYLMELNK